MTGCFRLTAAGSGSQLSPQSLPLKMLRINLDNSKLETRQAKLRSAILCYGALRVWVIITACEQKYVVWVIHNHHRDNPS